jgi:hypothetical protein
MFNPPSHYSKPTHDADKTAEDVPWCYQAKGGTL